MVICLTRLREEVGPAACRFWRVVLLILSQEAPVLYFSALYCALYMEDIYSYSSAFALRECHHGDITLQQYDPEDAWPPILGVFVFAPLIHS